ncbi:MAG TPA: nucleotidyl transferase AbiEii/AbiGii toxin family protein [Verrucomicrobiales bacterium]|nr:nucleotidyl transferase AbiEii/AbiGii toxin family protein [Verrucomicrobiales bacterium]
MDPQNSLNDYDHAEVQAARSVMLELVRILGEYREMIVLVGGWIPSLILPQPDDPGDRHCGSLDVDLALDHRNLCEGGYETIHQLLIAHGYEQAGGQPFQYVRKVGEFSIRVDLLAGEYGGTGQSRRTQKVQDVRPRKARGCDLAFEITATTIELEGKLPDGALDRVRMPVASAVPFLVMKAMALNDRLKPKDSYDIWYLLSHFPGGMDALAEVIRPHLHQGLVKEALGVLTEKYQIMDYVGPKHAADFDENLDTEFREQRQRDAFERMQLLLKMLS